MSVIAEPIQISINDRLFIDTTIERLPVFVSITNYLVEGNVFRASSANSIFFHSGSNNTVRNNIFANGTVLAGSPPGPTLLFKDITKGHQPPMRGNVLERNVVIVPRLVDTGMEPVPLLGGTSPHAVSSAQSG